MSIKAYVGRMGSGKTYELVSVVILGALARGRRVVSNVAGLDYPAMVDLLVDSGISADKLGKLIIVSHDDVLKPEFWRTDKDSEQGVDSFIQPGDLVALDEIWRFWSGFAEKTMPERVMNFFRMHRHFAHSETGLTCDVALITQDVMDVARRVRTVIEETYQMTKLTAIGSTRRYRVDVFQGSNIRRKPIRSLQRSYEKKYFPLYSSHSQKSQEGAGPVEENIDGRGNVLRGALFTVVLPVCVVLFAVSFFYLRSFFNPGPKSKASVAASAERSPAASSSSPDRPPGALSSPSVSPGSSVHEAKWFYVGAYSTPAGQLVSIVSDGSRSRFVYEHRGIEYSTLDQRVMVRDPSPGWITFWDRPALSAGVPGLAGSSGSSGSASVPVSSGVSGVPGVPGISGMPADAWKGGNHG